ncbi:transaldolase [Leifsonia xyli subsp. cynodontis DSM 46306]|uniref:Uncharacterized protein n=1 Tax=Leifsonia xyli subsp. cynodontis DSM 46306 TaxID=1389489 RepID=U3P7Y7_LEIXC|nr:hypothetical protein [Leifsonia xyli]AGW41579.1 transaldolase [Leifsonia xyli subsp. cynodontis DSM 46306]
MSVQVGAVSVPLRPPLSHRAALSLGRALIAWGTRHRTRPPTYHQRVDAMETTRDTAASILPQLPR